MPDPSSQQVSSIGGNVGTNAGGPHCLAYGVTSAHVLALDVVLSDGTVARVGSEGPEAAGYDLRGVVVGSEGTVGLVPAACVRLTPEPPAITTMLLDFATVEDCAATVSDDHRRRRRARGARDDGSGDRARRRSPSRTRAIRPMRRPCCSSRWTGSRRGSTRRRVEVEAAARAHGVGIDPGRGDRPTERALLWKGRKSAFGAIAQIAPALSPPRLRGASNEAGRGADRRLRDLPSRGHHRDERVPRRGRQSPSAALVRSERARRPRARASRVRGDRPTVRGCRWLALAASTASASRSGTSCRSCSQRTTSPPRRASGARSIRRAG